MKKFQKKTVKNQKFDFSEGHNFLLKKFWARATVNAAEFTTTCSTHWNQNLRFWKISSDKSQKASKNGQEIESLSFTSVSVTINVLYLMMLNCYVVF